MPNTRTPKTFLGSNTCDWTSHTTATCSTYPRYPQQQSPPTGYQRTRHTQTETNSPTIPDPSNSMPPHWATLRTPSSCDASKTPSVPPSTTRPCAQIASQHTCKNPNPTGPRAASAPHPVLPMVCTPLNPRPRWVHQMHLWPNRGRNLGPLQDVPPVPGARHPHRLEPNPHHRTTHRMADMVPVSPKTCHHPQTDRGTRGGPQEARPHCRLDPATHPRRRPPGHGSAG